MSLLNIFKSNKCKDEPKHIDLEKHDDNLNNVVINLSKKSPSLIDHKVKVKMVLDYSGSMDDLYRDGSVQSVITRLLPLALRFDDDGELGSFLFSNNYTQLDPVTINNYNDYVKKNILSSRMSMGGTYYAPVLEALHKGSNGSIPEFIIYITDGDNSDQAATDKIVRTISKDNMFIIFVGIGSSNFHYLEKLDNLDGRERDNTSFIKVSDFKDISDEALYSMLLEEYINWYNGNQ